MKKYSINQVDNLIPDQAVKKTLFEKFKSSIDKIFN
jgi:hypothetical protein